MPDKQHDIDFILHQWPFKPGVIAARLIRAGDGREVLQMRIEMGLLQMETTGRPDGEHPGGVDTCLDWLRELARSQGEPSRSAKRSAWRSTASLSSSITGGFAALALRQFGWALADADYTLQLMDFVGRDRHRPKWAPSGSVSGHEATGDR